MFLKYLLYFFLYFSGPAERGSSTRNTLTEHNEETNKDDSEEDDLSPSAVHHVTAGLQGGDSGPELEVYSASTVVPPPVWPPRSQLARSNSSGSGSSSFSGSGSGSTSNNDNNSGSGSNNKDKTNSNAIFNNGWASASQNPMPRAAELSIFETLQLDR